METSCIIDWLYLRLTFAFIFCSSFFLFSCSIFTLGTRYVALALQVKLAPLITQKNINNN